LSTFPGEDQQSIREQALDLAKLMAQTMRGDELTDPEHVEEVVKLSVSLAPQMTLDTKLREAADAKESPFAVVSELLRLARIAELSSFGQIASSRVDVIETLQNKKDAEGTPEDQFQNLIAAAPWLIDPQWSPVIANRTLKTLREEFEKYYFKMTGEVVSLSSFGVTKKRPDFVLLAEEGIVQIVEIKKPGYSFADPDFERMNRYVRVMRAFLSDPLNEPFSRFYPTFHVTLVCDGVNLSDVPAEAFDGLVARGIVTPINWSAFLLKTKRMHQEFLDEAERQRLTAIAGP
jgi:hypothetical protein